MNCEQYDELLGDYVDTSPRRSREAKAEEFERHLATCARCQALVADFTTIRRTASTLEEHVPPPRLWAKIASSIENKPRRVSTWIPVAVAASLAIVIAGATWMAWQHSPAAAPAGPTIAADDTPLPAAEAQYEEAIAGLQRLADAQNASLDPQTRAVLARNLATIDRAISESRAALASEPASTLAQDSLLDALDTKVALLQDTVALAAEDINQ
jgi:anti-sigma factor RsiW